MVLVAGCVTVVVIPEAKPVGIRVGGNRCEPLSIFFATKPRQILKTPGRICFATRGVHATNMFACYWILRRGPISWARIGGARSQLWMKTEREHSWRCKR